MEWQDISTAPKDGRSVDLWLVDDTNPTWPGQRAVDCYWYEGEWLESDGRTYHGIKPYRATHWMLIPEPPQ